MEILHRPERSDVPTAIALGGFDGLHRGHQAVLRAALGDPALCSAVFTFDSLPQVKHNRRLMSAAMQQSLLAQMGFARIYRADFHALHAMSPESFVTELLAKRLRAKKISCGFNYRFGYQGAGDSALLQKLCAPLGIAVAVVQPVMAEGAPVSSTRIRTLMEQGEAEAAAALLGRPFAIDFAVSHGRELGRTIGMPTINQVFPDDFVLPRFGVYASVAVVNGRRYAGVTNVGVKPTVGAERPLAETNILGFADDLYGQCIPLELHHFLRPEQKFPSVAALSAQMARDRAHAAALLGESGALRG